MSKNIKFEKVSYEQFNKDMKNLYNYSDEFISEIYDEINAPKRGTHKSAGYDFFSPIGFDLEPNETIMIPTGIRCIMPDDMVLMIFPRSGLGSKFRFTPCNLTGVIDADYADADNEGHIFMKMVNEGDKTVSISEGQAFCQGILLNYFTTIDDETTKTRTGGMGSTDNT